MQDERKKKSDPPPSDVSPTRDWLKLLLSLLLIVVGVEGLVRAVIGFGECWTLLSLYAIFIAWMVLETLGITSVIR